MKQREFARFVIEGEKGAGIDAYPEVYVDEDCQCGAKKKMFKSLG